MGIDPYVMGPVEILAGLWERLHPAARSLPDFDALKRVARIVQATSPDEAAAHRRAILDALTIGVEPVGIDATDRRWLEHADGTLEETMHLATVPQDTSPWWLAHLLQVSLPTTVAVHIRVGDRASANGDVGPGCALHDGRISELVLGAVRGEDRALARYAGTTPERLQGRFASLKADLSR